MLPPRYKPVTVSVTSGGYGKVQKILDTFLGRTVLFKSIKDRKNNSQIISELRSLAKARSRHVVEIYDVIIDKAGEMEGIIIELLTGRDFADFHKEAHRERKTYLLLLYQIATALSDLHRKGIKHRDLKLENLRASEAGILKLFDFGLSTDGDGYRTKDNRGTYVYAAPELYVTGAQITNQMDIYAFGVCAWALASETFPAVLLV